MIIAAIIVAIFTPVAIWAFVVEHRASVRRKADDDKWKREEQERQDKVGAANDKLLFAAKAKVAAAESELRVSSMVVKHFEDEEADIRRQLAERDAQEAAERR